MISARIVADSVNPSGNRLTTFVVTMPRIILAEFNTHRMLSKNSASSRAIPFPKMLKAVEESGFTPLAFQKDHKGMQGTEYFLPAADEHEHKALEDVEREWQEAKEGAIYSAKQLANLGVSKQICNRLLEPFMYHTVIVSGTEWENFFALRCPQYTHLNKTYRSWQDAIQDHLDLEIECSTLTKLSFNKGLAEIHMMQLAECMWDAYGNSIPRLLQPGEWHIPYREYISDLRIQEEWGNITSSFECEAIAVAIATTMAARTSYTVVGEDQKELTYKRMVEIHDEMKAARPLHASPFEHCAVVPEVYPMPSQYDSNFRGFIQYRKMLEYENVPQAPYKGETR